MAKDNNRNTIQNIINRLYSNTYYNNIEHKNALSTLRNNIDKSINSVIDKNVSNTGSNISKLYSRIKLKEVYGDKELEKKIQDLFSDEKMMEGVLNTYTSNRFIKELDDEIDIICKYVPKLEDAIETKVEMIMSSDDFIKSFMVRDISDTTGKNEEFNNRINTLKNTFKLNENFERSIYLICKYGEDFIYNPTYNDAFEKILKSKKDSKDKTYSFNSKGLSESCLLEGFNPEDFNIDEKINNLNINISISEDEYIYSILEQEEPIKRSKKIKAKPIIDPDALELPKDTINDGLMDKEKDDDTKLDINGCIFRRINKRYNVIPVYIDDICLGYYYIEHDLDNPFQYLEDLKNPLNMFNKISGSFNNDEIVKDNILKKFSKSISDIIDKKFINANQDLSREIYLILKYNYTKYDGNKNLNLRISFVPPEDMHHLYFKLDPITHRGISDLYKSLFPAKLYSCLYMTSTLGILTRSFDKRVYYVKQVVDTNIAQNLHNTISAIKKSNFGIREINNMNNMLGILGRYNDFIIPTNASGDKPIDIEVLQGQDIDTKPELMEMLESLIFNPIGIPLELIDSRRTIEFSRQLTLSNGKAARHCLRRQSIIEPMFSKIIIKLYNTTFNEDKVLEVILPPPTFLTITNTLNLLQDTQNVILAIVDMDIPKDQIDLPWVDIYKGKLLRYYMGNYVDFDAFDRFKEISKLEAKYLENTESEE